MNRTLLLKGGRVLDPASNTDGVMDVLVEDGAITAVEPCIEKADAQVLNVDGLLVLPGLIDMHVHLREPGYEYKETIASGAAAALAGGFTQVCCMANTMPVNDTGAITAFIIQRGKEANKAKVHPVGAVTKGLKGESMAEMGDMAEMGAVAFSDDGNPVADSEMMRRGLEYAKGLGKPVLSHPQDLSLTRGGSMHEGEVSTRLGLKGMPAAGEESMIARDLLLAAETGSHVHIQHVSTKRGVSLLRWAKALGIPYSAEATPHHLCLTHSEVEGYNTNAKVNPPLRTEEDRQAVVEGVQDGTLQVIATDHAPHSELEKDLEFDEAAFGISGIETAIAVLLSLVEKGELNLLRVVEALTIAPAQVLGLTEPAIAAGKPANISVIDPGIRWVPSAEGLLSKGKNNPWIGRDMKGRAVYTIVEGELRYALGERP